MSEPEKAAVQASAGRWDDLRKRVLSAIVMIAIGAGAIWAGGWPFAAFAVGVTALMLWELAGMTAPWKEVSPNLLASYAALTLALALVFGNVIGLLLLLGPGAVLLLTERRDRGLAAGYALLIMLAGYGLVELRHGAGIPALLWVILVVVASDVLGYFAGRMLGGPKFWPRISPKKTWSGTLAGWIGAALVGAGFVWFAGADRLLIPVSVVVAFAGQMGDIAESWIKRRAGVKDASTLIPGHGGVLDRFDALIGALVVVKLIGLVLPVTALIGG